MGVDGDDEDNPVPTKAAKRKAPNDGNEKYLTRVSFFVLS